MRMAQFETEFGPFAQHEVVKLPGLLLANMGNCLQMPVRLFELHLTSLQVQQLSMLELQHPAHPSGEFQIMGSDKGAKAFLENETKKFRVHVLGCFWIKITCRLVGEEQE